MNRKALKEIGLVAISISLLLLGFGIAKPLGFRTAIKPREGSVCCTVECKKGKCKSYTEPCGCICSPDGIPRCNKMSGGSIADGDFEITANEAELANIGETLNYLQRSANPHASEAYHQLLIIRNLFTANHGMITHAKQVELYNTAATSFSSLVTNYFTPAEQEVISNGGN